MIALGGPSRVVRIYSTADGELLHEIKKHTDWVYGVEFSPDGVLLATATAAAACSCGKPTRPASTRTCGATTAACAT